MKMMFLLISAKILSKPQKSRLKTHFHKWKKQCSFSLFTNLWNHFVKVSALIHLKRKPFQKKLRRKYFSIYVDTSKYMCPNLISCTLCCSWNFGGPFIEFQVIVGYATHITKYLFTAFTPRNIIWSPTCFCLFQQKCYFQYWYFWKRQKS